VPIANKVVKSNPANGEVCSIQLYVIKFVSDLRRVSGFPVVLFPPPITEILLKAALNTITHTINQSEPAPARESLIWKSNGYIKSLKIPKGQLEAVNQRTDNTMGKGQRDNQ